MDLGQGHLWSGEGEAGAGTRRLLLEGTAGPSAVSQGLAQSGAFVLFV